MMIVLETSYYARMITLKGHVTQVTNNVSSARLPSPQRNVSCRFMLLCCFQRFSLLMVTNSVNALKQSCAKVIFFLRSLWSFVQEESPNINSLKDQLLMAASIEMTAQERADINSSARMIDFVRCLKHSYQMARFAM